MNNMSTTRTCPRCGTRFTVESLTGLCPKCVLGKTLETPLLRGDSPVPVNEAVRFFGDYELLEEIERGGMGVVYRARQVSLNRVVAVKMILAGQFAGKEAVRRFRAEAEAAARLQHPNIVAIHEVGEEGGQPYFSMDYIAGRSLAALAREQPLPPAQAARYLRIIAEAVHYAHEQGTLHRDLKPSNVLIDSFDQPRVTDFGLAKRLNETSSTTTSGKAIGSPGYMPPEQVSGRRDALGPRNDVYGLGALLYHALTGRAPFAAETIEATLSQVLHNDPAPPTALNPNVPRDLETICLKCLEKEPARRYGSARELAEELGRFADGKPIEARPVALPGRLARWCRRNPVVAALTALALLLFVAGFAGVSWQWRRAEGYAKREGLRREQAERALTQLESEGLRSLGTNGPGFARVARRILRAEGYEESYRLARAEIWSQRAVSASPELTETWLVHSEVLLKQGRLAEALSALVRSPDDPEVLFRRGHLLCAHQRWLDAVTALTNAMAVAPFKNRTFHRRAASEAHRALFLAQPRSQATAAWLSILQIPERAPTTPAPCLDLSPHFNAALHEPWMNRAIRGNHLDVLRTGNQTLAGIEFDLRGVIQIASNSSESLEPGFPEAVRDIDVGRACRRIHFLHSAGFAYQPQGNDWVGYGRKIGAYLVRYVNGQELEIPLVSSENIDEWHTGKWTREPTQARVAWEGRIHMGAGTRLCVFTWVNPHPELAIQSFDFVSSMAEGAPFLLAVTVEP
jgi:hypothetical protein